MTGTLVTNNNVELIINWLKMAVNFEVNTKNYWVALSAIFSRKVQTKVVVDRMILEAPFSVDQRERYYNVVPSGLGGRAAKIDFKAATEISYEPVTHQIIEMVMLHLKTEVGVFVCARNARHQEELAELLNKRGVKDVFLLGKGNTISLTPADRAIGKYPRVCITTMYYVEGYEMTLYRVLITGVYFSNEASRHQLEGRINRLSQNMPDVRIIILHAGILTYIQRQYQKARNLAECIRGFAKEVGVDLTDIEY